MEYVTYVTSQNEAGKITFLKNEKNKSSIRYFYNDNGNKIGTLFTKYNNDGAPIFEMWEDFDDAGNRIHYKTSTGFEEWVTYYPNHKIHTVKKHTNGTETFIEYDKKGNIVPVVTEPVKTVQKSDFSLLSVVQYCALAVFVFVASTLLWQQIDVMEFGAALPSNADIISSSILTMAALGINFFKNKSKKQAQ
jgi:hypothetical protein